MVLSKELKTCHSRQGGYRWEELNALAFERVHQSQVRIGNFAEEPCCLLPLAFTRYVGVITTSKSENRKQMGLIAIIIAQVAPGLKVVGGNIGKRCRPKLRMISEKTCNLGCIEITDNALAAAPVIAVAIFRN